MRIRFRSIRAFIPAALLLSAMTMVVAPAFSQQGAPASPAAQTPPQPTAPSGTPSGTPATTPANQPATKPVLKTPADLAASVAASASKEPDYPDPRTITVGIYGLFSPNSPGPDIRGGAIAADDLTYETLNGIGRPYKIIPQGEFGVPVTRTGMVYADIERFHGSADLTLGRADFIDSYSYNAGDQISSTYHIITGRIYLDDLMYPHKFPVARLRFHSIWGMRYVSVTQTVDSATEDATAGLPGTSFALGTSYIFFPEFGAAMEYAITPHVLFRVDGAGFGFPHHSDLDETSATLSFRKKNLEFLMGVKTLHFKTSPQKEEYVIGTFVTPFFGLRWHFQ